MREYTVVIPSAAFRKAATLEENVAALKPLADKEVEAHCPGAQLIGVLDLVDSCVVDSKGTVVYDLKKQAMFALKFTYLVSEE